MRPKFPRSMLGALAAAALISSTEPAAAQAQEPAANRLFVEAQRLTLQAATVPLADRIRLLQQARENLKAIIERHPESSLAVKLISGQSIGTVSLEKADIALRDVTWARCKSMTPTITYDCILEHVLESGPSTDHEWPFRALQLAGVYIDKGDWLRARLVLGKATAAGAALPPDHQSGFEVAAQIAALRMERTGSPCRGQLQDFLSQEVLKKLKPGKGLAVEEIAQLVEAHSPADERDARLSDIYVQCGRPDLASEHMGKMPEGSVKSARLMAQATAFATRDEAIKARVALQSATSSKAGSQKSMDLASAATDVGAAFARAGDRNEAERLFDMALSAIDLSHALANAALAKVARAQFMAGLKDAAGVNLRRAALQASKMSTADRYIADVTAHALSLAYAAGGDFHSAERFARQIVENDFGGAEPHIVAALVQSGETARALRIADLAKSAVRPQFLMALAAALPTKEQK